MITVCSVSNEQKGVGLWYSDTDSTKCRMVNLSKCHFCSPHISHGPASDRAQVRGYRLAKYFLNCGTAYDENLVEVLSVKSISD